ncbi:flagellar biosynthesis protein FliC, partial [Alphaproteobacteria bacterium]|nr:flagellar biosynthesis protein FliC [Alphaproteobacteria bacterium]
MTAINTNTAALNAQFFMKKANSEMESAMSKLSSGKQVNSAADDAAGLAISSRMTSQLRGLSMAIKNAGDTVSLAQTAEGALEEVTNMLQRIRELAVQSANGTMNDSDRTSLDAEVQALKTEIDRVAETTSFNNRALLDGSFSANFQIGHEAGQTVGLQIGSVKTETLGLGGGSAAADSIVGGRMTLASFSAGDIKINGQDVGAFTAATDGTDVENVLKAINNNVDNVEATAFNTVVAKNKGNGV